MILNWFLPKFAHLNGQPFGGVLKSISFTTSCFGKNAKKKTTNNVFEDKRFLSKMFSHIIMQAATN